MSEQQQIEPFQSLPDGRLLTPWGEVLIGVEESLRHFRQWLVEFVVNEPLPLPEYLAMRAVLPDANFDQVCGHWIASRREKKGYFYISMGRDGRSRDTGIHIVAQMIIGSRLVPELRTDGTIIPPHVDHRCRLHACFNPWHTEVTTSGENTRRGARARQDIALHEAGHRPLIGRHEIAP